MATPVFNDRFVEKKISLANNYLEAAYKAIQELNSDGAFDKVRGTSYVNKIQTIRGGLLKIHEVINEFKKIRR